MGQICWLANHCMEASKAGNVWPVSGSRQWKCLEVGRRWLNAGGLEEEKEQEEENKEDRVPPVTRGPCRHTGLDVCCFWFFSLTCSSKQYWSFLLKRLLA